MPTEELGLARDILAGNEASGQQPFISTAVTTQPSRDLRKEGGQAAPRPPCPHLGSGPPSTLVSPAGAPGPQLPSLHVQIPPLSKTATSSTALMDSPEERGSLPS